MTEESMDRVKRRFELVMKKHPEADPETVITILQILEEPPIDRLNRALYLGRMPLFNRSTDLYPPFPRDE